MGAIWALLVLGNVLFQEQSCTVTVQPGQSIQQALNTVAEGALVCVAAGTFTENFTITKSLALRGAGRDKTILRGTIRIEQDRQIQVTLTGCTITEARFGAGVRISGQALVTLDDVAITQSFMGMLAVGSAQVALTNAQVLENQFNGVHAEDSAHVTLQNVRIAHNGFDGLVAKDSTTLQVNESVIEDNKHCGVWVLSGKISGTPNAMRGNGADLCGFAPSAIRKPLVAQTDKTQLTVPGDFQDIQEALDALAPGGTVLLQNGTYAVGLTIWKPVTLRGPAALTAVPDRQLIVSTIAEAQGALLDGVTLTGSRGDGALLYGQTTFQNAQISKHADDGVEIAGSAVVQMIQTAVFDNGDDGIFLSERAQLTLTNSMISSNKGDGIEARDFTRVKLQNTQVFNNMARGLDIRIAAQLDVSGSQIVGNKADGMVLRDSVQAHLEAAQILKNGADGLLVTDKARATIADSTISANGSHGGEVSGMATIEVRRSTIENNGTPESCMRADTLCTGLVLIGDAQARLMDSVVRTNTDWGIMAWLKRCGAPFDFFNGQVTFAGTNTLESNNRSGNHKGNPGTHPFANLPDGQVCLP